MFTETSFQTEEEEEEVLIAIKTHCRGIRAHRLAQSQEFCLGRHFTWGRNAATPRPPPTNHSNTLIRSSFVHAEEAQPCASSNDGSTFTRLEKMGKGGVGIYKT